MVTGKLVLVNCSITRGAFSDDRIFRVQIQGETVYTGAASRRYCYDKNNQPLGTGGPRAHEQVEGKIVARVIRSEDESMLLSLPDGAVVTIPSDQVTEFQGALRDVSVQP